MISQIRDLLYEQMGDIWTLWLSNQRTRVLQMLYVTKNRHYLCVFSNIWIMVFGCFLQQNLIKMKIKEKFLVSHIPEITTGTQAWEAVPEFMESIFSSPSPSQILGTDVFISFLYPIFGNGIIHSCSSSRTPESHSCSSLLEPSRSLAAKAISALFLSHRCSKGRSI